MMRNSLQQQQLPKERIFWGYGLVRTLVVAAFGFAFGATFSRNNSFHDIDLLRSLNDASPGRELSSQVQEQQVIHDTVRTADCVDPEEKNSLQRQIEDLKQLARPGNPAQDVTYCREKVFATKWDPVGDDAIEGVCNNNAVWRTHGVCQDLADFTGMDMDEVIVRMKRMHNFHFEQEHLFWNPQSKSQLAWYYATSQSYLFANSIHTARVRYLSVLKNDIHEPVFDYSGGVGESVLHLAIDRGMKCQYFGIGMIEKEFAQFRVAKKGLQHLITFVHPWSERSDFKFDPVKALPQDGSLGSILATDVLEHIPNYHIVVKAMVDSLKVGGIIIENSPFATDSVGDGTDLRIHVHNGGISMEEAMGERMVHHPEEGYWEKIKN